MNRCRAWLIVLVGLGLVPSTVRAQDAPASTRRDRLWFAAAAGYGRTQHDSRHPVNGGIAGGLSLTYQPGPLLFTGRLTSVWDPFESDQVADVALMVGVGTRDRSSHVSISAGPALASGNLDVFRDDVRFSDRLGAAVQVQALTIPLDGLGFGLTAFANFNRRQSFGGVMLTLAFGQLR